MTKILTFVRREPVRAVLVPLITVLVGYLVARGVLTDATAPIVLAAAAVVLGVPAAEVIRSRVTPVATVQDVVQKAARDALTVAVNNQTASPEVSDALNNIVRTVNARIGGRHRAES